MRERPLPLEIPMCDVQPVSMELDRIEAELRKAREYLARSYHETAVARWQGKIDQLTQEIQRLGREHGLAPG